MGISAHKPSVTFLGEAIGGVNSSIRLTKGQRFHRGDATIRFEIRMRSKLQGRGSIPFKATDAVDSQGGGRMRHALIVLGSGEQ